MVINDVGIEMCVIETRMNYGSEYIELITSHYSKDHAEKLTHIYWEDKTLIGVTCVAI